ncbi:MAG: hypothetical protein O3A84_11105 [Proteobacteria bacterium]|nr:hypothetical protein [Pseudomonadota bacterium]
MNQTINKLFARILDNTKPATPYAVLFGLILFAFFGGAFSTLDADRVPDRFVEFELESAETAKLKFILSSASKADAISEYSRTLVPELDIAAFSGGTTRSTDCAEFQRQNRAPPCPS